MGAVIFGSTLVLLYTMSTLYHAFRGPRVKKVFKILDHSAIYLLIAGTYTPFTLGAIRGAWGWSLFGIIWGLAILGVSLKSVLYAKWVPAIVPKAVDHLHTLPDLPVPPRRMKMISTGLYLAMGWLIVIAIVAALARATRAGPGLALRRRLLLHGGRGLLQLALAAFQPRHLAPLRGGGEPLPFLRRALVCDPRRMIAWTLLPGLARLDLEALAARPEPVWIHGPPGSGRSALAAEVAPPARRGGIGSGAFSAPGRGRGPAPPRMARGWA